MKDTVQRIDLSIIIVSWNTQDLLRDCLRSVKQHTTQTYEIWVVDNNSSDGTVEMLRNEFPEIHVIRNDANLGFARANNQAFAYARGRYVALLNPDTVLLNSAFDIILDYMKACDDCGAAGPKLTNLDGTLQGVCARSAPGLRSEILQAFGSRKRTVLSEENQDVSRDVEALSGACMVVRRDILKSTILNEKYFMFVEDLELCCHVRNCARKRIHYVSDAHVMHLGGQSTKQTCGLAVEESYGIYHHLRLSRGPLVALISRSLSLFAALVRLPVGIKEWVFGDRDRAIVYLREMTAVVFWAVGLNISPGKNRH